MNSTSRHLLAGGLALGLATTVGASTPLNAIISVDDPEGNMGGARVRVVHASPDAPAVDVWVEGGPAERCIPSRSSRGRVRR